MALSTLQNIKLQANIPQNDTSRDLQYSAILTGVTAYVKQKLNRDLEQATYTEWYSGDSSPILLLNQRPVTSVASVYLDNSAYWDQGTTPFGPSTLLVQGVDYALRQLSSTKGDGVGRLYRIVGSWTAPPRRQMGYVSNLPGIGIGNIQVTYTAGYATIPADLAMAVNALVIRVANSAIFGGIISGGNYEDASMTLADPKVAATMFGSLENMLAQYDEIAV